MGGSIMARKMTTSSSTSTMLLLLGLLVLASLPSPSEQTEVAFNDWMSWNNLVYSTPDDSETPTLDEELVAANDNKTMIHMGIDPDGTTKGADGAKHRSIADALAVVPDGNTKRYVFTLKAGAVFREKVVVDKSKRFVTFKSDPANPAVVVWNDTAATLGKDGKPLGVVGSATVAIEADYFVAYGVVFKNDGPSTGAKRGQTVAVRVAGTKATFYNCTIEGGQGTLYDDKGRHFFSECTINGGVDAIFGFGRSFYEGCRVVVSSSKQAAAAVSTAQTPPRPAKGKLGVEEAGKTTLKSGFSFYNCTIEAAAGAAADDKVYLNRAWDDSSYVVYTNTKIANEVVPIGYHRRSVLKPADRSGAYYGVYNCSGPGLEASKKMGWAEELTDGFPYNNRDFVLGGTWIRPQPAPTD